MPAVTRSLISDDSSSAIAPMIVKHRPAHGAVCVHLVLDAAFLRAPMVKWIRLGGKRCTSSIEIYHCDHRAGRDDLFGWVFLGADAAEGRQVRTSLPGFSTIRVLARFQASLSNS